MDAHPITVSRLAIGWALALGVMLMAAWGDPQSRTQEARVLLGAREMLEGPAIRWLIPTANGQIRLNKPPLAYWLSAGSYAVFGKSVLAGRIPAVIASGLTIALTFLIGRRLFNERAGLYAAGTLLASWSFFRFGALAETDVIVMCLLAASVYAMLRARDSRKTATRWLYLIAVLIGLIVMTKGPSAGYVLLLMILIDAIDGAFNGQFLRESLTKRFITTGAIGLTLLVGLPWFIYIFVASDWRMLTHDLSNSARGGLGHSEPWWSYLPQVLLATVPWVFVWMIAGLASLKVILKKASDDADRVSLLIIYAWGIAIFLPLLLWGNKQPHYLMSLLPALMLTVGWGIDRAQKQTQQALRTPVFATLIGMMIAGLIGGISVVLLAWKIRPGVTTFDIAICAMLTAGILFAMAVVRWSKAVGLPIATIASMAAAFVLMKAIWAPTLEPPGSRQLAEQLHQRYPGATFVFRDEASLTLCVAMRQVIASMNDEQLEALAVQPRTGQQVICLDEVSGEPLPLHRYKRLARLESGEDDLVVFTPDLLPIATR